MTETIPETIPETLPRTRPKRRVMRTARRVSVVVVLAAAIGACGFVLVRKDPAKSAAPPTILKTAEVTAGDLTTTEKIDGSLQLSDSLNVLHRIEGQTSSADTTSASAAGPSSGSAPGGSAGSSASGLAAAGIRASIIDLAAVVPPGCPGGTPAPTTTSTSDPSSTTSVPSTLSGATCPSTSGTGVPTSPPSTTPDATTAPATSPATTLPTNASVPVGDPTTTATTPVDASPSSVAGAPTGGGAGGGGGARTGTGATGGTGTGGSSSSAATTRVTQTVTSITRVGTTIALGDVLYTIDSHPVVALSGTLPAWRTLSTASDDGPDIRQLESSLVSLGYDPDGTVTVDDTFGSTTEAMVKRWQTGLGVDATGTVDLGSVVFVPTTTTVSAVPAAVGDAVGDGDTIVTLTAATQDVVIDVPDGDEAFIVPGLEVQLGSGTGTVSLLRSTERDSAVVVQAVIIPAAPIEGVANGGTVKVTITTDDVAGVLIVPANALLSHLDGTYAVQVQAADGTINWHTVELLGVSGNTVGIRGDGIAAGTLVLVPV